MTTQTEPIRIGPLTGDEWASFALGDDPRNPLPPCCANISEARDELIGVMRSGGEPDMCWRTVAVAWQLIESCSTEGTWRNEPTLVKLWDFYLASRDLTGDVDWAEAKAHLMGRTLAEVQPFLELLDGPECPWDLKTHEGWNAALARIGGAFVAYIRDPDERMRAADELRAHLGLDGYEMAMIIDVLRAHEGLPYDPTHPDHRQP